MQTEEKSFDVLEDLKDAAGEALKPRLTDPIISTYVISFIATNWDLWLLIFSGDLDPEARIRRIHELFSFLAEDSSVRWWGALHRWLLPAFVTWIYIYVWQWATKSVLKRVEKDRVERENFQIDALEGRVDIRKKIESLQTRLNEAKKTDETRLKAIGALEQKVKDLGNELEVERVNKIPKTLANNEAFTINDVEMAEFEQPIFDYAKTHGFTLGRGIADYSNKVTTTLLELKNRYSQSTSAAQMYGDWVGKLKGDPMAQLSFGDSLDRFSDYGGLTDEDKALIHQIQIVVKRIDEARR